MFDRIFSINLNQQNYSSLSKYYYNYENGNLKTMITTNDDSKIEEILSTFNKYIDESPSNQTNESSVSQQVNDSSDWNVQGWD